MCVGKRYVTSGLSTWWPECSQMHTRVTRTELRSHLGKRPRRTDDGRASAVSLDHEYTCVPATSSPLFQILFGHSSNGKPSLS